MNARPDFSCKLHTGRSPTIQAIVFLVVTGSCWVFAQDKPDPGAAELKKAMTELLTAIKDGNDTKIAELTAKVLPDAERIGKGLGAGAGDGKEKVVAFHARMPKDGQALARLFAVKSAQTGVQEVTEGPPFP